MAYLAKANLALSVTITSIATLLAPLMTPLLMKLLAGAMVEIQLGKMMWEIVKMIIIPIGAGLIFNKLLAGKSQWLDKAMPLLSMFGIAFILTIMVAAGRKNLLDHGSRTHWHSVDAQFLRLLPGLLGRPRLQAERIRLQNHRH
jgi:Predicted Na+-dependent transporter